MGQMLKTYWDIDPAPQHSQNMALRRPLADAGMSKEEVRETARLLGLPNYDKPSMPCLSSRVQYGQIITPEKLLRIERSRRTNPLSDRRKRIESS